MTVCAICQGTQRVKRYIGHPGRCAVFVCSDCPAPASEKSAKVARATSEKVASSPSVPQQKPLSD